MFFSRTKTGRLALPSTLKTVEKVDITGLTINWAGYPVAKIGDIVHFSRGVSAGTIGMIVSTENLGDDGKTWLSASIKSLDGKTDSAWLWSCLVLSDDAVQEVIDFYEADNRPGRIKFNPLKESK